MARAFHRHSFPRLGRLENLWSKTPVRPRAVLPSSRTPVEIYSAPVQALRYLLLPRPQAAAIRPQHQSMLPVRSRTETQGAGTHSVSWVRPTDVQALHSPRAHTSLHGVPKSGMPYLEYGCRGLL